MWKLQLRYLKGEWSDSYQTRCTRKEIRELCKYRNKYAMAGIKYRVRKVEDEAS